MSKLYRLLSTVSILMILVFPSGFDMLQRPEQVLLQENLYLPLVMRSAVNPGSPTNTPSPTATRTPTSTRGSFSSSTPIPTATQTPTVTITPTVTLTPTYTATTTLIPLPSITIQYPTLTPSPTPSPTASQTPTPSPGYPVGFFSGLTQAGWLTIILLGLLWAILAVWLYVFLRQRG